MTERRSGVYKMIRFKDGRSLITIPKEIAELLPPDLRFSCQIVEGGLLFRPVHIPSPPDIKNLPKWVKHDN